MRACRSALTVAFLYCCHGTAQWETWSLWRLCHFRGDAVECQSVIPQWLGVDVSCFKRKWEMTEMALLIGKTLALCGWICNVFV